MPQRHREPDAEVTPSDGSLNNVLQFAKEEEDAELLITRWVNLADRVLGNKKNSRKIA